ncbi:hypothetical protein BGZ63DRAFT_492842 [Mariannaea sp. PMI_226]|nr:hypothetical protein BGZ63DRAFT_492842 [Mariannaea sp. PMI_226]
MGSGSDSNPAAASGVDAAVVPGPARGPVGSPTPGAADDDNTKAAGGSGNNKREAADEDAPTSDAGGGGVETSEPTRKKKKFGPGSRGVANLTPEQLAKKRANDREAQRAIRERTKNQIDSLERRIKELTNQQPYQELQAAIRAKEAAEQENVEIKRRLAGIVAMLQPLIGQVAIDQAYISPAQTYAPPIHPNQLPLDSMNNVSTPGSASSPQSHGPTSMQSHQQHWQPHPHSSESMQSVDVQATHQLNQQRHDLRHSLDIGPERLGLDFLLESTQRVSRIHSGINSAQDTPAYHHLPMKHDWTNGNTMVHTPHQRASSWGPQGKPMHQGFEQQQQQQQHQQQQQQQQQLLQAQHSGPSPGPSVCTPGGPNSTPGLPIAPRSDQIINDYSAMIKHSAPTCPLDSLLLDFLSERRQRAADGISVQEVVGPRYPSVSSLLNPAQSVYSHPLSKVFTDILSTFPDISNLPERVAVLYVMFLVMRWQIAPTQENYERLPEWIVPLPSQLNTPHPAWVDHIPFPRMRDRLSRDFTPALYAFDNFFIPYTTTLSLSWPYEDTDTLIQNPEGDELMINPVFERHLRNLDNWKLGDAFAKAFPTLVDTFNLDSRSPTAPRSTSSR